MAYTNGLGHNDVGRYGPVSQLPKTEPDSLVPPPPPYYNEQHSVSVATPASVTPHSRFDPRGWSLRRKIIVSLCVMILIVVIIVGAYEGVEKNRYPDYSPLNYSLTDTFEGTDFFSNFQYWSAADPAEGYVQYVLFDPPVDICLVPNIV